LSGIANQYQSYKFNGLLFEYKSTSGNSLNSTNATLGSVALATNYDVTAAPFVNKREVFSSEFASVCAPTQDLLHPVECKKGYNVLESYFVRRGAPSSNVNVARPVAGVYSTNNPNFMNISDLRFNDVGLFQICTEGMQAANTILGELWVTYDITLSKPIGFTQPPYAHYKFNVSSPTDMFGLFNSAAYFAPSLSAASIALMRSVATPSIPPTLVSAGSNTPNQGTDNFGLTFTTVLAPDGVHRARCYFPSSMPSGNYMITWYIQTYGGGVVCPRGPTSNGYFAGADGTKYYTGNSCYYPAFGYNGVKSQAVIPLNNVTYGDYLGSEWVLTSPGPQLVDTIFSGTPYGQGMTYTAIDNLSGSQTAVQNPANIQGFTPAVGPATSAITTVGAVAGMNAAQSGISQTFTFTVTDAFEPGHYIEWVAEQSDTSRNCLPYMNCNAGGISIAGAVNGHFYMYRLPDLNP
jgi:hypothetical protein